MVIAYSNIGIETKPVFISIEKSLAELGDDEDRLLPHAPHFEDFLKGLGRLSVEGPIGLEELMANRLAPEKTGIVLPNIDIRFWHEYKIILDSREIGSYREIYDEKTGKLAIQSYNGILPGVFNGLYFKDIKDYPILLQFNYRMGDETETPLLNGRKVLGLRQDGHERIRFP